MFVVERKVKRNYQQKLSTNSLERKCKHYQRRPSKLIFNLLVYRTKGMRVGLMGAYIYITKIGV